MAFFPSSVKAIAIKRVSCFPDGDELDGKKYRCPECEQIYGSSAALKAHVKSHADESAFRCQICGRHFAREEERLAHMSRVHPSKSRGEKAATSS